MDRADLELFERSLRHATESATGPPLDAALAELGWDEALSLDRHAAVSVLFGLQGRANATSTALDHVVLDAMSGDPGAGIVLPPLGSWAPAGALAGDRVRVRGLGSAGLAGHESALVPTATGPVLVAVADLDVRAVGGMDPALGLVEVAGEADATPAGGGDWDGAVAVAQVALGHELVGAGRRMLELAREHALEREQFGHVIAGFQAIRHRLADTLFAIEVAEAVLDAAWIDHASGTAAMAKALAGRGARTAARHCQQVLAGIGFTTEHDLHLYVKRVFVLDELFGSDRTLTRALGEELLAGRLLPELLPL